MIISSQRAAGERNRVDRSPGYASPAAGAPRVNPTSRIETTGEQGLEVMQNPSVAHRMRPPQSVLLETSPPRLIGVGRSSRKLRAGWNSDRSCGLRGTVRVAES